MRSVVSCSSNRDSLGSQLLRTVRIFHVPVEEQTVIVTGGASKLGSMSPESTAACPCMRSCASEAVTVTTLSVQDIFNTENVLPSADDGSKPHEVTLGATWVLPRKVRWQIPPTRFTSANT
jgi:hypothetical protein